MILFTGLALLVQQAGTLPLPPPQDEIVVTGTRQNKDAEQAPLGSRITRAKEPDPRGFVSQIASDTGPAGMVPGSGMDPFAGGTRNVTVKTCKASDTRLSLAARCDLAAIQRKMKAGDQAGALAAIHRLSERADVTALDRFFARRFQYQIAEGANDQAGRREAIEAMLETGVMARADQRAARRTLVAMALRRGDDKAAIAELERLVLAVPDDSASQANLAALYARYGRHDDARAHMALAVAAVRARAGDVPQGWTDYLAERR